MADGRPRSDLTVNHALDDYLQWHRAHGKSYAHPFLCTVERYIRPALGSVILESLTTRKLRGFGGMDLLKPRCEGAAPSMR